MKIEKPILSKIVGSTFCNGQEVIKTLKKNEQLIWEREPQNKFDPNAIAVYSQKKEKIGYIPKDLAKELTEGLNSNVKAMTVIVNDITGSEQKNVGCNVIITCYDKTDLL